MKRVWLWTGAMALVLTTGAGAAWADVSGRVRHIDPATRTIEFWDERVIQLGPGATFFIDGRQVTLDQVTPGTTVIVREGTVAPEAPAAGVTQPRVGIVQHGMGQRDALTTHPPVDVSGRVAHVDRQQGLVVFEDGRVMRLTQDSELWQAGRVDRLQPGMDVYIRDARPAGFQPAGAADSRGDYRMGRVRQIEQDGRTVILHDGTRVRVSPGTKFHMGQQAVTVTDLRPGDQVVVRVKPPAATAGAEAAALPRAVVGVPTGDTLTIDPEDVHIFRYRFQAP